MKLLHIDSSITGEHSVSRRLSGAIVRSLRLADPSLEIVRADLDRDPVFHLDSRALVGLATDTAVLDQFLAADVIVIGAPMYNFGVPSQLKAWIDRILVAGRTFRYAADGTPIGLVGEKRVILALSRGGYYGAGAPSNPNEHAESYLRAVLGFIGVTDPEVVIAEGLAVGPEHRAAAVTGAERRIAALAA